jgi:hypothetical protein
MPNAGAVPAGGVRARGSSGYLVVKLMLITAINVMMRIGLFMLFPFVACKLVLTHLDSAPNFSVRPRSSYFNRRERGRP